MLMISSRNPSVRSVSSPPWCAIVHASDERHVADRYQCKRIFPFDGFSLHPVRVFGWASLLNLDDVRRALLAAVAPYVRTL